MNILILSWRGVGHPNAGGAEISTYQHAKGWVKYGHDVTLLTSYYPGGKREEVIDGIKIKRYGGQFLGVHWQAFKWYVWGEHKKFDLVIDEFHGIPFLTPLYVKVKKLAFIHEVAKEVWGSNFNPMIAYLGSLIEPLVFQFYKNNYFMTVSKSTKNDLVTWGIPAQKVYIILNGIKKPQFKQIPPKEQKKTLMYLGALAKDKGIEDALVIFSIISKIKNWQFWVAGKGSSDYLDKLKKQMKSLNLEGKVKFWGFVNEKKKNELLARAHLVVNPSIREGWGLVVIEAAAAGTPTVAYNVPGLRDSIIDGKTGILSSEQSVSSLSSAITKLLDDKKMYQKLRTNALAWSKQYSWEKAVEKSLELLEKAAD